MIEKQYDEADQHVTLPKEFVDFCHSHTLTRQLPEVVMTTRPEVAVRLNRAKNATPSPAAEHVPWAQNGYYLDERVPFTFDPALHQGLYYVQDASSMVVGHIIEQLTEGNQKPLVCLDACAAPGGKTTAIIDALPDGSLLVANEYDSRRASALVENIERWGCPSVMVTRGDTSRFTALQSAFDIITADVPCSGEGMMRKDPTAVSQWSRALVASCATLQRQIVDNLWQALRPGGYMVYSTCTFNTIENEENVQYIIDKYGGTSVAVTGLEQYGIAKGIDTDLHCYRFIPGLVRGEGLFIAVIRKPGGDQGVNNVKIKASRNKNNASRSLVDKKISAEIKKWLIGDYDLEMLPSGMLVARPAANARQMKTIGDVVGGVMLSGVNIGTIKGRDIIPSYALARSTALNSEAFSRVEIGWEQAVAYLRREAITFDDTAPRGVILLTYNQRPLGFMKNIGSRANTLLPSDRRILSTNIPNVKPEVIG